MLPMGKKIYRENNVWKKISIFLSMSTLGLHRLTVFVFKWSFREKIEKLLKRLISKNVDSLQIQKFQLPQFVWTLRSSVWDVFNNFLHVDATDRSKITSDQKLLFIAVSLYSFFTNTPLNYYHHMINLSM